MITIRLEELSVLASTPTREDVPEVQKDDDVLPAVVRLQTSLRHYTRWGNSVHAGRNLTTQPTTHAGDCNAVWVCRASDPAVEKKRSYYNPASASPVLIRNVAVTTDESSRHHSLAPEHCACCDVPASHEYLPIPIVSIARLHNQLQMKCSEIQTVHALIRPHRFRLKARFESVRLQVQQRETDLMFEMEVQNANANATASAVQVRRQANARVLESKCGWLQSRLEPPMSFCRQACSAATPRRRALTAWRLSSVLEAGNRGRSQTPCIADDGCSTCRSRAGPLTDDHATGLCADQGQEAREPRTGLDSLRGRPGFSRVEIVRATPLSAGFLGDLPPPPPSNFGAAPYSPRFALFGSQDLDVKSGPDLFTNSSLTAVVAGSVSVHPVYSEESVPNAMIEVPVGPIVQSASLTLRCSDDRSRRLSSRWSFLALLVALIARRTIAQSPDSH
ncbi:hypothetical protein PR048_004301 [Dryococelus australis]|uniref:Uncharacterized protein n=1 Tax=Dryococelus australis TaxID=614101 RepID=A0ABQ9I522_9NEOP|nr:hypothetical protein PR048_004301 [Dryococelus australis]